MAIPLIGSLGDVVRANALGQEASQYLGQSMIGLGNQIAQTVTIKAATAEAERVAPFLQESYLSAYDDITKGQAAQGLGKVVALGAQFGANPILSRLTTEATRTAGLLANETYGMMQQQLSVKSRENMFFGEQDIKNQERIQTLEGDLARYQNNLSKVSAPEQRQQILDAIKQTQAQLEEARNLTTPPRTPTPLIMDVGGEQTGVISPPPTAKPSQPTQPPQDATAGQQPPASQAQQPADAIANNSQGPITAQPMANQEATVRVLGEMPVFVSRSGDRGEVTTTTKDDGSVSIVVKEKDGKETSLPKNLNDAMLAITSDIPKIPSGLADDIAALKGMSNVRFDFNGSDTEGYNVSMRVLVPDKSGKQTERKIDYVERDSNGIPTGKTLDKDQKNALQSIESNWAIVKNAPSFGQYFVKFLPAGGPEVTMGNKQASLYQPLLATLPQGLPFGLTEEEFQKQIGKSYQGKPENALIGKVELYRIVDDLSQSKAFDGKTPDQQRGAFIDEAKKQAMKKGTILNTLMQPQDQQAKPTDREKQLIEAGIPEDVVKNFAWDAITQSAPAKAIESWVTFNKDKWNNTKSFVLARNAEFEFVNREAEVRWMQKIGKITKEQADSAIRKLKSDKDDYIKSLK